MIHALPMLNAHTSSSYGGAGDTYFEISSVALNSSDRYNHLILAFAGQSARSGIVGKFRVPNNYVTDAKIEVVWVTTATAGDVAWDIDYTAIAENESYDPSSDQQTATVTSTAPGTARLLKLATIVLTSANFAPGDEVQFIFVRDAADAADTLAATAFLAGLYFSYSDQ